MSTKVIHKTINHKNITGLAESSANKNATSEANANKTAEAEEPKKKMLGKTHNKNPTSGQKKFGEVSEDFDKALIIAQKWRKNFKTPEDIPDSEVP